jgi:phosphoribosylformimino-5-aminoimidazole carboxamide ribotide isomerase
VYGDDPALMARRWLDEGATRLHVVDLDGARSGRQENAGAVGSILERVPIPIELGGGVRDLTRIETWLAAGVDRVYLGTAAVEDPRLVQEACLLYPGRVGVAADARDGHIAVRGWQQGKGPALGEFLKEMVGAGAAFISYTDISRDGTLQGLDLSWLDALTQLIPSSVELILAGGVGSLEDILTAARHPRVDGVIVGRALYDGRVDLREAMDALRSMP